MGMGVLAFCFIIVIEWKERKNTRVNSGDVFSNIREREKEAEHTGGMSKKVMEKFVSRRNIHKNWANQWVIQIHCVPKFDGEKHAHILILYKNLLIA